MNPVPVQLGAQFVGWGLAAGSAAASGLMGFAQRLQSALDGGGSPPPATAEGGSASAALRTTSAGESRFAHRAALQQQLASLLETFHQTLQGVLSAGQVSPDGFHIQQDELGDLRVVGEHPQSREIERLMAADESLASMFAGIADVARLLHSAGDLGSLVAPNGPASPAAGSTPGVTLRVTPTRTTAELSDMAG